MTEHPTPADAGSRRGALGRFLDLVEWLGNLLPHPVTLFAILSAGMLVCWVVLFYLWVFALGLPVGPGTTTLLVPN
jgi:aminobenzoyl-glutamate transport protein